MGSLGHMSTSDEHILLEQALAGLDDWRSRLGDVVVAVARSVMQEKLNGLKTGGSSPRVPQERKPITVLFADVSGFTAMSETMDHEVVNDVINSLWTRVDRAIVGPGGRIDKHIGDAIMALYGAPVAHANDPERAIRSALQIQSEIQDWKAQQSKLFPNYTTQIQNIQLRIGINTGFALLGTVGTVGEYTALGDTVKLANQLESAAPKGGILISQDTYEAVEGIFNVTQLESLSIKGRSQPVWARAVQGISPDYASELRIASDNSDAHVDDLRQDFESAITRLEAEQAALGNVIIDTALAAAREKLAELTGERPALRIPQQRKLVTVLFADISGFTAMFEAMDQATVNDVIDSLWSRVDRAIQDQGGRVDKHIFDVVMALFGIPTAHEDDPDRAIRAALRIQSEVRAWIREQAERLPEYKTQIENIQLRIGVNTGPALLGTVGTVGEFTAIGDTVNLAQRLEANAPRGEIMISYDTHQHVRGIFDVTALDPIMVKGKRDPIQVFTVNGVRPRSFRDTTRGLEGVETRTIGRDAELAQMKAAFELMDAQNNTCLITLIAEAGIGKSRLLFEFGKYIDALEKSVLVFKGRASQETARIPYALLRGILASVFGIQENDSVSVARGKLEQGILNYTGNQENAVLYAHFIGHLIGFDYSTSPHLKGILSDAQQIRNLAFQYGSQFFAEIARSRIVVVFLEDVHWADSDSLDFFETLMNKQPGLPLLIVALTRATLFEQRPDWGAVQVQTLNITLPPLSEADTRLLIAEILQKAPAIPETLVDMIVQKAEGSPFYVEELIKVLIEGGVIARGKDQWSVRLDRLSELKVPTTLTGLLQARLDSLGSDARETIQQAAVVGRVFWMDIVEHMHNPEVASVREAAPIAERLGALRSKEMIYLYEESAAADASEFIFKNQILHDVTYESVLLRLRPSYHAQVADGLVEVGGERAKEYAGRVGEHYERAEEWLKAAEWYAQAGAQAQNIYANEVAINYYQKALGFLNEYGGEQQVAQKLDVYKSLGEVLTGQGRYDEAIENWNAMLQYAEANQNLIAQANALKGRGGSQLYQGDYHAAIDSEVQAEGLARRVDDKTILARALTVEGVSRSRLGETQTALALAEQALAIFTELNNTGEMARSLNLIGVIHYSSGRFDEAQRNWEGALDLSKELGDRDLGMDLSNNLGVIAEARGDYETALQRYEGALAIAREIGNRNNEILFLTNRGCAQVALRQYDVAEMNLRQAISLAGITGSWCMPLSYNYRAEALLALGKPDEAFYSARQALVLAEEDKAPEYIGLAWRTLGMICSRINNTVRFSDWETHQEREFDAEFCFNKSLQVLTDAEIDSERARTLRAWARHAMLHGDKDKGAQMWQESRELFVKLGAYLEADKMKDLPV